MLRHRKQVGKTQVEEKAFYAFGSMQLPKDHSLRQDGYSLKDIDLKLDLCVSVLLNGHMSILLNSV